MYSAEVTATILNGIRNIGTGSVTASNLSGAEVYNVFNSGTGQITLSGSANSLTLKNEGTGDFKGFDFPVLDADVTLIGTGNCEVHCTETLNVRIEGSGDVYYKGDPTLQVEIEGSGKVIDAN